MLKLAVLVSGGGTNLQAIIDAISAGKITNACISVVISNNANAYALERARAHGIEALCISPKDFESREAFNQAFLDKLNSYNVDLVVLAGFLVVLPEMMIKEYTNRIVNIHPSLIPSFCGKGFYGLKVHEGVLARGVKVTGAPRDKQYRRVSRHCPRLGAHGATRHQGEGHLLRLLQCGVVGQETQVQDHAGARRQDGQTL